MSFSDLIRARITGKTLFNYSESIKLKFYLTENFNINNLDNLSSEDKFILAHHHHNKISKIYLNEIVKGCPNYISYLNYNVGVFPEEFINKINLNRHDCSKINYDRYILEIIFELENASNIAWSIRSSLNRDSLDVFLISSIKINGKIKIKENYDNLVFLLKNGIITPRKIIHLISLTDIYDIDKDSRFN
jgi:hypothetical protein